MISHKAFLTENMEIRQYYGRTSNIYLIISRETQETYLVDCGVPSDTRGLLAVLNSLPPLKRVLVTHFHVDHITGWITLKKAYPQAEIWFHQKARPLVDGRERILFPSLSDFLEIIYPCVKAYGFLPGMRDILQGGRYGTPFKAGFPADRVRYFSEYQEVLPGFTTFHTPGHRSDSVSFLHPGSGVFLTGDFLLVMHGLVVVNSYVFCKKAQEKSVNKIKQVKSIQYIYPGHGRCIPFDVTDLST